MGLMITPSGRLYDPRTGRFLSRDPIRVPGANQYAALEGNPLRVVDPSGNDEKAIPPWPERLPLNLDFVRPGPFPRDATFRVEGKDYAPKTEKEWADVHLKFALEKAKKLQAEAREALSKRKGVTTLECDMNEENKIRNTIAWLQEKLGNVDPKRCPPPCCHLDFKALVDLLGKLEVTCVPELRTEKGIAAAGMARGVTSYKIEVDKKSLTFGQEYVGGVVVHEALHTGTFQFQDKPTRYWKDPTAEEMKDCIMDCIKGQPTKKGG